MKFCLTPIPTAYSSQQGLESLATLDTITGIGDVDVPDGWFMAARAGKKRRGRRELAPKLALAPADNAIGPQFKRLPSSSSNSPPSDPYVSPYQKPTTLPLASSGQLVPLQSATYPRRNPTDEQYLRHFSLNLF